MNIPEQATAKVVIDTALGTGAVTSPWWLTFMQGGLNTAAIILGVILIIVRIAVGIKELRKKDND